MIRQQLYINGSAVDMPADEIKIKVESNILSDADKTMTAHSYNICLPRTMANDTLFALAYIPTANTGGVSTHTYLTASLYVDGVPLFEDGQAVLTSVDENGYNLNLYWGLVDVFDEIKNEGLELCDLPMSQYWQTSYNNWRTLGRYNGTSEDGDVATYNSGMTTDIYDHTLSEDSKDVVDSKVWNLPVVKATEIMTKIAKLYSLKFNYSTDFATRLGKIYIPLTTLNMTAEDEEMWWIFKGTWAQDTDNFYYLTSNIFTATTSSNELKHNCATTEQTGAQYNWVCDCEKMHVKSIHVYGSCASPFLAMSADENGTYDTQNATLGSNGYELDYTFAPKYVEKGDVLVSIANTDGGQSTPPTTDISVKVTIDEFPDCERFDYWEYTRNYPNIKVLDFISEMLAHCGGFIVGSVTKSNAINFVTFDEVAQATPVNYDMQGLQLIEMTLDDLAQKNEYLHKENDDEEKMSDYLASGVIYTSDSTLELEREAYKSSFKVPRTNIIKLWNVEDDKATWNNAGNYIVAKDHLSIGGVYGYWGSSMDFANIINDYYADYESIVTRPKAIEVIVRLSVLQLLAFDFTKPVYIKQLNRSYLVKTIESEKGEEYKLTLIQI